MKLMKQIKDALADIFANGRKTASLVKTKKKGWPLIFERFPKLPRKVHLEKKRYWALPSGRNET